MARNMTLLFFLERLLDKGEPRTLHDLSCQFGAKGFTREMRQIAGGSQSGESLQSESEIAAIVCMRSSGEMAGRESQAQRLHSFESIERRNSSQCFATDIVYVFHYDYFELSNIICMCPTHFSCGGPNNRTRHAIHLSVRPLSCVRARKSGGNTSTVSSMSSTDYPLYEGGTLAGDWTVYSAFGRLGTEK